MFFWAVSYLPLADTVTFYLAGPIYVTALSVLLLGERVGWRRWTAVLVGFGGVLLALRPSAATFTLPALIALTGSILLCLPDDRDTVAARNLEHRAGGRPDRRHADLRRAVGAVRLGDADVARFPAAVDVRRAVDRRARLRQLFAQARAGERGRALSVHVHPVGDRARLPGVRRRARRPVADRRRHHRRGRPLHLLARAGSASPGAATARRVPWPSPRSSRTDKLSMSDHGSRHLRHARLRACQSARSRRKRSHGTERRRARARGASTTPVHT